MLLCGWPPPVIDTACDDRDVLLPAEEGAYTFLPRIFPHTWLVGSGEPPAVLSVMTECECAGICESSSVTVCSPPVWPRLRRLSPLPCPACSGAEPWRLRRAKVVLPS